MISKTIQNEIIDILYKVIIEQIIINVTKNKYFSILCDETTDISTKEQITFSVRYNVQILINTFEINYSNSISF